MKVSVKMNRGAVRRLSEAQAKALSMTASEILSRTRNDGVMPFDIGTMQNESTFVDDSKILSGTVSIAVDTPYARRLYFNPDYDFNRMKNVNAGGEWFEGWITGKRKKEAIKIYKQFYKRTAGGIVR